MRKKGHTILISLLTAIIVPAELSTGLVSGKPGSLNKDARPDGEDCPTLGRRYTWLGDRDVTLNWELPSPGA